MSVHRLTTCTNCIIARDLFVLNSATGNHFLAHFPVMPNHSRAGSCVSSWCVCTDNNMASAEVAAGAGAEAGVKLDPASLQKAVDAELYQLPDWLRHTTYEGPGSACPYRPKEIIANQ